MAIFAFVYVVLIKKQKIKLSSEKPKIAAGVFETAGQFAYIFAMGDNAIIAAPLISSYCLFSVVWARILLKEKLHWKQYLAIAVAMIGIVILGMEK
jgi:drug/metabolite transporter (DMT)-like permease